ncbi:MAG: aminoglycoside phosphotransferase family protein [Myxococcota bacterium]
MMISRENIGPYLTERRLLPLEELHAGKVRVYARGSRNNNLVIERAEGNDFFVKQSRISFDPSSIQTLRREAMFYFVVAADPAYEKLRDLLIRCYLFDTARNIVVLDHLTGFESLFDRRLRHGPCSAQIGESIARALATLHVHGAAAVGSSPHPDVFPQALVNGLAAIDAPISTIKPGFDHIKRALNADPVVMNVMRSLRDTWSPTTLIHNDLKSQNILVRREQADDDETSLYLIDWELVDRGDPCWDLGSILSDGLYSYLLDSCGIKTGIEQLAQIQPFLSGFWNRYCSDAGLSGQARRSMTERAVSMAGACLLNKAFEVAYMSDPLPLHGQLCLQTAFNILRAPQVAMTQIFGIE